MRLSYKSIDSNKILFAGASSLFGLSDIKRYYKENSKRNVSFVENSFMSSTMSNEDLVHTYIAEHINYDDYEIIIPLNEFWITQCYKYRIANISETALKASRDKVFFNDCLLKNNMEGCKQFDINDLDKLIARTREKFVIKPKYSYSGNGVFVVSEINISDLDKIIDAANMGMETTKSITGLESNNLSLWRYEDGIEYSTDIFIENGKIYPIRICQKKISIIKGRPCVLLYKTVSMESTFYDTLRQWCSILFSKNDISFAQFDFIKRKTDGICIPIDFCARVGGGIHSIFKYLGINPYLNGIKHQPYCIPENCVQVNLISDKSGIVFNDNYSFDGMYVFKKKFTGDHVGNNITSVSARLAELVINNPKSFDENKMIRIALSGNDYMRINDDILVKLAKCLTFADKFLGKNNPTALYLGKLKQIEHIEDIYADVHLKNYSNAVILTLFGLAFFKKIGLKLTICKTYLVIHPLFLSNEVLIENEMMSYIKNRPDIKCSKHAYQFTKVLATTFYGGTMWFEPYVKLCNMMNVFDKISTCYEIVSTEGLDCVRFMVDFKNMFRAKHPNLICERSFDDCEFNGRINPFHTPDSIENDSHINVVEKFLVK